MSFLDQATTSRTAQVTVLTPGFQATATLKIFGMLQTFLNDEQRPVLTLLDAGVYGLERGNPAASLRVPELYVPKHECHAVVFHEEIAAEQLGLMPRAESLAVYTSHFAIQGQFYMGTDALLADFIASSKAQFVVTRQISIFPLFTAQAAIVQQAPVAFIHRAAVKMHHRV